MSSTETGASELVPSPPAPILRLYPDVWLRMLRFLDARSLKNLLCTGNRTLVLCVARNARTASFEDFGLILDFEVLLSFCERFQLLQELVVSAPFGTSIARWPSKGVLLPSNLTTLKISFHGIFSLISPLSLSLMVPALQTLSLDAQGAPSRYRLSHFDFPSSLQCLELYSARCSIGLDPYGVSRLPRNLVEFSIAYYCSKTCPEEEMQGFGDNFSSYVWPLSLLSCSLEAPISTIKMEHLPRTVTRMDLSKHEALGTDFGEKLENAFPWRVFFPRLQFIDWIDEYKIQTGFLTSLALPYALDTQKVDAFIGTGFWHLPEVFGPVIRLPSYPLFQRISIPSWWRHEDKMAEELEMHAPLFREACFPGIRCDRLSYRLLSNYSEVKLFGILPKDTIQLPSNVRSVDAHTVYADLVPPSITSLRCGVLVGKQLTFNDPVVAPISEMPSNLSSLAFERFNGSDMMSFLPKTLTSLEMQLSRAVEWNVVATRLLSLKTLSIELEPSWVWSEALESVSSQLLDKVDIFVPQSAESPNWPMLAQFFGAKNVFPPSLKSLTLNGAVYCNASILPVLPRSLTKLTIARFAWKTRGRPFPDTENMTPRELLRSLPPNLRQLRFFQQAAGDTQVDCEELEGLPRSLLVFQHRGHFAFSSETKPTTSFSSIMPPYILEFKGNEGNDDLGDWNSFSGRCLNGFLN